jgi:hypothetical protein
MLPVLAFLVLALPAAACADWSLVRGSGPLASFESSARPAVAVKTSCGFSTVAQGKMTVMLHDERSLDGMENGTVWYCLSARDGGDSQLAVALADANGRGWYPSNVGSQFENARILYSCGSDRPDTGDQRVFVRPVSLDPWMDAFKAHDAGWNASVLVSQYEWLDTTSGTKLLVEYREPLAVEQCPIIEEADLKAFVLRANTAFSARFSEGIPSDSITPYSWDSTGVSARLLSDVLGATTSNIGS